MARHWPGQTPLSDDARQADPLATANPALAYQSLLCECRDSIRTWWFCYNGYAPAICALDRTE